MYAIAKLPADMMIRLFPVTPGGEPGKGWQSVFHRRSRLREGVPCFNTLDEAVAALDDDPESIIMQFKQDRTCEAIYFTQEQQDEQLHHRLHYWSGCYGGFEVRTR